MAQVTVVVGGQYGSEAKGATVAFLARDFGVSDAVIRVAGPNAGHTAYDKDGREWKLRAVPVAAVVNEHCELHIAAGSEIDPGVLHDEIHTLERAGHRVQGRLKIHPSATFLDPVRHPSKEKSAGLVGQIGSTGKGIGAARADRIMRQALTFAEFAASAGPSLPAQKGEDNGTWWETQLGDPGPFDLEGYGRVVIEGTQGYGLGLHTANYPQVTSSDCRAIDFLAMAGISPWDEQVEALDVLIVARAFPIRVAGNSGPLMDETTWDALGLPEERTTVTNKIRRVGAWDDWLLAEAIKANGGGGWNPQVQLVLTMVDQRFPEVAGKTQLTTDAIEWIERIENRHEIECVAVGTGPQTMFPMHNGEDNRK